VSDDADFPDGLRSGLGASFKGLAIVTVALATGFAEVGGAGGVWRESEGFCIEGTLPAALDGAGTGLVP